jgi:hypothetical protein
LLSFATLEEDHVSIDPDDIKLTDEQRRLLAERAQDTGRPWTELLEELFATLPQHTTNGDKPRRTLFEALNERGMIGAFDGPGDLSTNPKHMEGFGEPRYAADSD